MSAHTVISACLHLIFIHPSVRSLSVWLTDLLFVYFSVYLDLYQSFFLSVHLSYLSTCLSVYIFVYLYFCLYFYLSISIYLSIRGVNQMVRHDTISILIPSDMIFADTSKNSMIRLRFDSIQEYIDRYIDIMILYTYFKQPSTFLLTHKCN